MTIPAEITILEARLKLARIPLSRMLRKAGVDRSTWSRWRRGLVDPTVSHWRAALAAVDGLTDPDSVASKPDHGAAAGA